MKVNEKLISTLNSLLAGEVKDYATHDFLQQILNDEDSHMDAIEELQNQIEQMTLQVFLTTQVNE